MGVNQSPQYGQQEVQKVDANGNPIQILGHVNGVGVPSSSHSLGVAAASGGTQLTVTLGDANNITEWEFTFFDGTSTATFASGTAETVLIKMNGTITAGQFTMTTYTDFAWPASVYPVWRQKFAAGQTTISFGTTTGGTKPVRVSARRLQ